MEKNQKKTFIIFLIGFTIGVIGFVSSFIVYLNNNEIEEINYEIGDKKEKISGGLVFTSIDKSIHLESVIPTLDKFGVMEKGFSFSIKNNKLKEINYALKLDDNDSTIKNSNIRYELTKNNEVVTIDTLSDDGLLEKSIINSGEEIKYTIKLWLDYNSEIKVGNLNKKIAIVEIDEDDNQKINKPVLIDGMIPVYYDNDTNSWYKAKEDKWYSYDDANWANALTVNNNKRKYYLESPVDTKIEIEDINSMWVWIPRFNYQLNGFDININFVSKKEKAYQAFTFNDNELDGFWFTKFESALKFDSECITSNLTKKCNTSNSQLYFVPNYPFATKMTMANMFYAIRKMELKNNIYGFKASGTKVNNDGTIKNDQNDFDIHMIKNSEWQAVALLSSSKYGKTGNNKYDKNNLAIINNGSVLTGKSYYDDNEYDYNVSLKGEAASTTGNVSGIYDMAGGKREYVMINNSEQDIFNKKSNSGFIGKVKEYYYDNDFIESDTTLILKEKYSGENEINKKPITRGGYKTSGNIFNLYGPTDYIDKISVETNSRACLVVMKEKNNEKKES